MVDSIMCISRFKCINAREPQILYIFIIKCEFHTEENFTKKINILFLSLSEYL